MTTVGIMGFGRIGRNLFRILYARRHRIVAIGDVAEPEALEYLLKFDTILGRFPEEVSVETAPLRRGPPDPLLPAKEPGDVDGATGGGHGHRGDRASRTAPSSRATWTWGPSA